MASSSSSSSSSPKGVPSTGSASAVARDLTGRVMNFFATANNETIGACVVGLGAVTYFVFGRVGLVLIGAVGGIVLHATWDGERAGLALDGGAETQRRKEVGLDIVKRLLDAQSQANGNAEGGGEEKAELDVQLASRKELNFDDFPQETGAALTELVDAVISDYVSFWYAPILPGEKSFPFECRQTLTAFLLAASSHISRKRPADTFLNFLTNATSIIIVFLSELSNALMAPGVQDREVSELIRGYLEEKPDSNLATVLNKEQQEKKFKMVADDVLQSFLESKAYNCEPAKVFLREVLAGLIFEGTLQSCSKQDFINGWIVYLLEEGESEIVSVIDAGVSSATGKSVGKSNSQQDTLKSPEEATPQISHRRSASKAEQAMEDAMQEAKRLSELIAAEEAKKSGQSEDASSSASTEQAATPTSSQSDIQASANEVEKLVEESAVLNDEPVLEETPVKSKAFTSFDQILPMHRASSEHSGPPPLTLHKASVTIFDDSQPGEKGNIRSRPVIDYLLQIEPASSQHRGWMTARKYGDFETLHEVLRRISIISGVPDFTARHGTLPSWKNQTKASLRTELEEYLHDALLYEPLAESEGMKRFLEKEQQLGRPVHSKGVLGFPTPEAFQTMGKGMLDVLAIAPKGAAGGGKALLTGVSGVFGGPKKGHSGMRGGLARTDSGASQPQTPEDPSTVLSTSSLHLPSRPSQESSSSPGLESMKTPPPLPERPVTPAGLGILSEDESTRAWGSQDSSVIDVSRPSSQASGPGSLASFDIQARLPPPPSEITDDYSSLHDSATQRTTSDSFHDTIPTPASLHNLSQSSPSPYKVDEEQQQQLQTPTSALGPSSQHGFEDDALTTTTPATTSNSQPKPNPSNTSTSSSAPPAPAPAPQTQPPLTEQEAQVAIELIFAVINELYTLSGAWQIRRTLLNAAKTFLLRPGNPSLESIRALLQDSCIAANTSDAGLALQLRKLRENALPTAEELAAWPPPLTAEESEALRVKARRLLVGRGMPAALMGVMSASASGEALGRVFDSLQVEEVARGLVFAMLLQGVRAVTH